LHVAESGFGCIIPTTTDQGVAADIIININNIINNSNNIINNSNNNNNNKESLLVGPIHQPVSVAAEGIPPERGVQSSPALRAKQHMQGITQATIQLKLMIDEVIARNPIILRASKTIR
jgi:hypothetical protein